MDFHNALQLAKEDSKLESFVSVDEGNLDGFRGQAKRIFRVKRNCPLICTYNISESLHNGSMCTFLEKVDENRCIIEKDDTQFEIKRKTWTNVNREGTIVGSRTQIPLALFWSSTVHKAQGLELSSVAIHSDYEFVSGLFYTALSCPKARKFATARL